MTIPCGQWRKSVMGLVRRDGLWTIRGPLMGKKWYWLYYKGGRVTVTGEYKDAVGFASVKEAKAFVNKIVNVDVVNTRYTYRMK